MEAPAAGSALNITDDDHPDDSDEWGGDEDNVTHLWPYLQDIFWYIGVKDSFSQKNEKKVFVFLLAYYH